MIKLFVSCHKNSPVPAHPLLQPIQVGTALKPEAFPGFLHDNTGDNISIQNRSYCELTAQYWAWKNYKSDYYGFFHYRRYLYPDEKTRKPYCLEKNLTLEMLQKYNFDFFKMLIPQYGMILPISEEMHVSVREHYAQAPFHYIQDLLLAEEITKSMYPAVVPAMDSYLSQSRLYFGNIFIMQRDVFSDYCSWLFPILSAFENQTDLTSRSPEEMRATGYVAERLLGIYYTYRKNELKTLELPRVHFLSGREYYQKKFINILLPPGSILRSKVKKMRQ